MYIEYRVIKGILHVRYGPDEDFRPLDTPRITSAYQEVKRERDALRAELDTLRDKIHKVWGLSKEDIPFYAYGDNQAACQMADALTAIFELVDNRAYWQKEE